MDYKAFLLILGIIAALMYIKFYFFPDTQIPLIDEAVTRLSSPLQPYITNINDITTQLLNPSPLQTISVGFLASGVATAIRSYFANKAQQKSQILLEDKDNQVSLICDELDEVKQSNIDLGVKVDLASKEKELAELKLLSAEDSIKKLEADKQKLIEQRNLLSGDLKEEVAKLVLEDKKVH